MLARFEHKLHATELSPAELSAVAAFLVLNVEEFAPLMRYDLPLKVGRPCLGQHPLGQVLTPAQDTFRCIAHFGPWWDLSLPCHGQPFCATNPHSSPLAWSTFLGAALVELGSSSRCLSHSFRA